ncbi:MAG: hypothetical protein KatS3mg060_1627 [Dehalococcoidia bacterium]|nr:MAG: hypothetical protein KatS3mg060_1627 [Dehalococcoidia bacterium]
MVYGYVIYCRRRFGSPSHDHGSRDFVQGHLGSSHQTAVIAALLHDIGVLAQRSSDSAGPTTGHAALAAAFVAERAPAPFRAASTAILAHHRPDDRMSRLVAAADRLAAGGPDDEDAGRPILQRRSPFSQLTLGLAENAPGRPATFFPVGPLTAELEDLTPRSAPLEREDVRRRLLALAEMIATEHTTASSPDFAAYVEGLLDLVWRTAALVPAPAREPANDISLAAHLQVSAALAACLAADGVEDPQLDAIAAGDDSALDAPVAVLLAARFSRCPAHPGDALSLEGLQARSFLDAELTAAIGDWLLTSLGVPATGRLALAADSFLMLLPQTAAQRLPELTHEIERRLLDAGGNIVMTVASTSVTGREVSRGIGPAMDRLRAGLERNAGRPFGSLSAVEHSRLFAPYDPADDEPAEHYAQFAAALSDARFLLIETVAQVDGPSSIQRSLAAFGRRVTPLAGVPVDDLGDGVTAAQLARLGGVGPHDPAARAWAVRQRVPVSLGSRPAIRPAAGPAGMALLEVDLDFSTDLLVAGHAEAPLARLVDVLQLLGHFFSTVGPAAAERQATGGLPVVDRTTDGVTLAGRPDELPRLGFALAQSLGALANDHPAVRLSAAVGDRFGSAEAQRRAVHARLRTNAKQYRRGRGPTRVGRDKGAITFLGATVGWEEFRSVWERFNRLTDLVTKRRVPSRLIAVARAGELASSRGAWSWRATFALRELARNGRLPDADAANLTNELARPDAAARLALAARWAEQALSSQSAEARHE